MKRFLLAALFTIFAFYSYPTDVSAGQLNCQLIPDVSGLLTINISRIELRISDKDVAYMGLEIDYQNPSDRNEFLRVIKRHIPLIISKKKNPNEKKFGEMILTYYTEKEEEDRLKEVSDKSDPIAYVQWRTKQNPIHGRDEQDGPFRVCLMSFDGNFVSFDGQRLELEFLSENVTNGNQYNIFSGMEYRLGDIYHIHRINRDDLKALFELGENND